MLRSLRRTHPTYELLSRAADRELPAAEAMELNAHLAECRECREEVDFMVDLRLRLRELSGPTPPDTLLPEILGRRSAGERRILDLGDVWSDEDARGRARPAIPAAAALVALAGGFALFAAGGIEAGANRFSFDVSESGAVQDVEFRTSGRWAEEPVLQARGMSFESADEPWRDVSPVEIELTLELRQTGRFTSGEALPSSVVYARFAVEDPTGELVDDGAGRWEHLALGADGLPTFDALLMKARAEVSADNYAAALETTDRLITRFEDRPAAWFWRLTVEDDGVQEPGAGARHERRLARFLQTLRPDASPDHVAALALYARTLGHEDEFLDLAGRLAISAPDHPVASMSREMAALAGSPADVLANLEALWSTHGFASPSAFSSAMRIAEATGDTDAAVRWFDRWVYVRPAERLEAARWLAQLAHASTEVASRIDETLRWIEAGRAPRAVGLSLSQHSRALDLERLDLLKLTARSLQAAGRADDALAKLLPVAELAWRPDALELVADLATETGQQSTAIRYHLLGSVMPSQVEESTASHDDALRVLGLDGAELTARKRAARSELADRMLEAGNPSHAPTSIIVESAAGLSQDMMGQLGTGVTIIHFGAPHSPSTVGRLARSIEACDEFSERGVRLTAVSHDRLSPADTDAAESCFSGWLFDRHREARRALEARGFGEIIVLDENGLVRFRGSDPADARRAALLLAGPA